tara:strand:+ start:1864 stop:2133 length:270 start_codon:yes stop_codon:yes gene_type:complete
MKISLNLFIIFVIAASAFMVVYIKHLNRLMNIEIETTDKKITLEINDYKNLLDKKTKILNKVLLEEKITKDLNMVLPNKERIIYLNSIE